MTEDQKKFEVSLNEFSPFQGPDEIAEADMFLQDKALQQVKTSYTTAVAVQRPRSIETVAKNVLMESRLAGASFFYRWDVKNKKTGIKSIVQGPSIDLAMCIARNYGNCAIEIESTESKTHYMLKGIFIDLETGFTVPRLFRQRKSQDIGNKYGQERAEDIIFQIAQSKAQRNAIVKAMPAWLIDKAIDVARNAEISKIKPDNMVLARANVLDFFSKYGIDTPRIEEKINRQVDQWTAEDIVDLRAAATALKDGRITPNDLFPTTDGVSEETEDLAAKILNGKDEPEPTITTEKFTDAELSLKPGDVKIPVKGAVETANMVDAALLWYDTKFWMKTKTTGFTAFCVDNSDKLNEIPDGAACKYKGKSMRVIDAMREKWYSCNPQKPFPGDKPDPEPTTDKTNIGHNGIDATGGDDPSESEVEPETQTDNGLNGVKDNLAYHRQMNLRLREDFPQEWDLARHELDFGMLVTSEDAAERWNAKISEMLDKQDNGE